MCDQLRAADMPKREELFAKIKVEALMRGDGASGTRNTRPEGGRKSRIN
jgi:hypothetical protein